jgi:hypothetical protein
VAALAQAIPGPVLPYCHASRVMLVWLRVNALCARLPHTHNLSLSPSLDQFLHVLRTREDGLLESSSVQFPSFLFLICLAHLPTFCLLLPAALRPERRCANPSRRAAVHIILWSYPSLYYLSDLLSVLPGLTSAPPSRATLERKGS